MRKILSALLGIFLLSGTALAETFTGIVTKAVAEDEISVETVYEIWVDGRPYKLIGMDEDLAPNTPVSIEGDMNEEGHIVVNSYEIIYVLQGGAAGHVGPPINQTGDIKVWAILVSARDEPSVITYAEAQEVYTYIEDFYTDQSDGKYNMQVEIYEASVHYNANITCTNIWTDWVDYVDADLALQGLDKHSEDGPVHIQYVFPAGMSDTCMGTGYGYFNNLTTFIHPRTTWSLETIAYYNIHEFGHNLNLHHSQSDLTNDGRFIDAYGDVTSPMGNPNYVTVGFSAADHKRLWRADRVVRLQDCVDDGTHITAPIERGGPILVLPDYRSPTGEVIMSARSSDSPSEHLTDLPFVDYSTNPRYHNERNQMIVSTEGLNIHIDSKPEAINTIQWTGVTVPPDHADAAYGRDIHRSDANGRTITVIGYAPEWFGGDLWWKLKTDGCETDSCHP